MLDLKDRLEATCQLAQENLGKSAEKYRRQYNRKAKNRKREARDGRSEARQSQAETRKQEVDLLAQQIRLESKWDWTQSKVWE